MSMVSSMDNASVLFGTFRFLFAGPTMPLPNGREVSRLRLILLLFLSLLRRLRIIRSLVIKLQVSFQSSEDQGLEHKGREKTLARTIL